VALRGAGAELVRITLGRPEFQLLRIEVDGHRVAFSQGGAPLWRGRIAAPAAGLALCATKGPAEFSGLSLTPGWEDLFEEEDEDPAGLGWEVLAGTWTVSGGRLRGEMEGAIAKGPLFPSYLAVINARLEEGEGYDFMPATPAGSEGPRIELEWSGTAWALRAVEQIFPLPSAFDPAIDQQFRFRKVAGELEIAWEGLTLGTVEAPPGPTRVGMATPRGEASFEAVRVTAL
jgi:hypothetical protein